MKEKESGKEAFRSAKAVFKTLLLLLLPICFCTSAEALNRIQNYNFAGNANGWAAERNLNTIVPQPRARDTNMGTWAYNAANGGCFYCFFDPNAADRDANAVISHYFTTPASPFNMRVRFDHRDVSAGGFDYHYLIGTLRYTNGALYPNENILHTFYEDYACAHKAAWVTDEVEYSNPPTSANLVYRVHWHIGGDAAHDGGAYVDNLRVDVSPTGLSGAPSGLDNLLTWNVSTGPATGTALLNVATPYKVYRSTDPAGPWDATAFVNNSTTNSFTDSGQSGQTVVYYAVSDVDTVGVESPKSLIWPIIRMDVRDGSGADVDCLAADDIPMNWVAPVITKTGYQVALGTTPGGSDIVAWTNKAAAATSHTFTGVTLSAGVQYYTSIRVVNGATTYNSSSSDGFKRPGVRDGTGVDESVVSSITDCSMNWDVAGDAVRYEVAIGTSAGGSDVVSWTNVGGANAHNFTGLSLTNDTTYYCSIRVYDAADLLLGTYSSNGFLALVNFSTTVSDGSGSDLDAWATKTSIDINWVDVPVSKVRYEAALGITPGGTEIKGWTDMALATSGTLSGLSLVNGTTYYCSVRIIHSTGPLPADTSDGFTFYSISVRDGAGADEDYSLFPNMIKCNWDAFPGPVSRYEAAIGNSPGDTSVSGGWISQGTSTSATISGLTLVDGNIYYCSVRIIDAGGNSMGSASSNGVQITLPTAITVRDGIGPDISSSFFDNRVEANWDHPAIALVRYEIAVGTSKYAEDIYPFTDVGHVNRAAVTTGILEDTRQYFVTVRGINAFEVVQALGVSDGFTARKDQVLVDTASQSFFNNARVIDRVAIANDSIGPVNFQGTGGTVGYWRYRMPVTVTEPGVTDRINAPCRVQFNIPVAVQRPGNVNEFRVADEHGNELPRYNLPTGTTTNPDIVFLVNMGNSEVKTYWIYWGNTSVSDDRRLDPLLYPQNPGAWH